MNTDPIDQLDQWLRGDFVRINTALEEQYFAARIDVICGRPDVDALKTQLLRQGGPLMQRLADMPDAPRRSARQLPAARARRSLPRRMSAARGSLV